MKFGLFGSAQAKRGGPDLDSGQGFREYIEYNVEAEALGYDSIFVVEHHFTGFGQVSASLNLLTWVAARTKTLRLGTAVIVLPWHNPVLLAEQAATIDLLSGGRLEFGVGKGYRHNEFASFCIPQEEADERFEEGLALILKSWTSERALLAPRQVLALRGHHRRAADRAEAASADLDGGGQPGFDPQGGAARLQAAARPARLDGGGDRALQHLQGRGREPAAGGSIRWMSACQPRLLRRANAEEKAKAIEARLANQQRLAKAGRMRRAGSSKSSLLSFDQTPWTPPATARCSARRTRSRRSSKRCAPAASSTCCSTARPARARIFARFARDVMPAFAGSQRARRAARS